MKNVLFLLFVTSTLFAHEVHIRDAETHNSSDGSQKRASEYLIEKFKFRGHEKILDLGCGDGKQSAYLTHFIPEGQVTGVDLSPNMITFAKKNFPYQQYPNLSFNQGNACYLDYENSFDVIFSFTALQWAEDHEKALTCMRRALKSNGTIALAMPMSFPLTMEQVIDEMAFHNKWRPFLVDFSTGYNFVSQEGYQELLTKTGFDITLIEKMPQKDFFESKESLSSFMSQWFPYLRAIPEDLKCEFMSQFLDRYFELEEIDVKGGDSIYFYPTHLIVIAHKR